MKAQRRSPTHKVNIGSLQDNLTQDQWDGLLAGIYQYARETKADDFQLDRCIQRMKDTTVVENHRMKGFGSALYRTIEIASYARKYPEEWTDTLLHEAAHLIDDILGDGKGHGPSWKRIAALVGAKPERCGPALPENRSRNTVVYQCADCGCTWSRSRRYSDEHYHTKCKDQPKRGKLVLISHHNAAIMQAEKDFWK